MSTGNASASGRTRGGGPRTVRGKRNSSQNAIRHGLRAAAVLVTGEDPAAFDQLHAGVVADLAPEGALEEELVDRVAVLLWRLRRVVLAETAAAKQSAMDGEASIEKASTEIHGESSDDLITRHGILCCAVAHLDGDSSTAWAAPTVIDALHAIYGQPIDGDGGMGVEDTLQTALARAARTTGAPLNAIVARVRASLDGEAEDANAKIEAHYRWVAAESDRRAFLEAATIEKLCRYETHLDRSLTRALATLAALKPGGALPIRASSFGKIAQGGKS